MSLKTLLKTGKNVRKLFGKKEIDIMLKQLDGFHLTQSERNRLSRDIKPKLDMIKQMAAFQDEFQMKKNQDNKRIISKAVEVILMDTLKKSIRAILLFGSFASHSATARSDIDICVVFDAISLKESTQFRIRIQGQLSDKVDIQVFNALPQKIKKSIAKNHNVLFRRKSFDNTAFTLQNLKYDDYFARMERIFGEV